MAEKNQKLKRRQERDSPLTHFSKALSYILRHGALKENLIIASDGFVKVSDLLQHQKFKQYTLANIIEVVESNDKKRFQLLERENGEMFIRAVQGHSIGVVEDDDLCELIEDPEQFPVVVHGSYFRNWESIKSQGMKCMTRNQMHFAIGEPGDSVVSGFRSNTDLFIYVDLKKGMADGIKFYISKNKVVLTKGLAGVLSSKYFKKVMLHSGQILFENTKEYAIQQQNIIQQQDMIQSSLPIQQCLNNQEEQKVDNNNRQQMQEICAYDYLLVLDFEAQCDNKNKQEVQEIIEFPVVVLDVSTCEVLPKQFHFYVKPEYYPKLTDFCTKLTGITQEQVEKGISLKEVMQRLDSFLQQEQIIQKRFAFVTCGNWDLMTCLPKEAKYKELQYPDYLKKWINIKEVYAEHMKQKSNKIGMDGMLRMLGLDLVGRHHSGIDDANNIARIAQVLMNLLRHGRRFERSLHQQKFVQ